MKISITLNYKNISKECESVKYFFKVISYYSLQLKLNSSLIIIILFHVLEVVAADENVQYSNEEIGYSADYKQNKIEEKVMQVPTVKEGTYEKEKPTNSVRRYKIVDVEFHRVETPVLIAMWIFCASVAKICEYY